MEPQRVAGIVYSLNYLHIKGFGFLSEEDCAYTNTPEFQEQVEEIGTGRWGRLLHSKVGKCNCPRCCSVCPNPGPKCRTCPAPE